MFTVSFALDDWTTGRLDQLHFHTVESVNNPVDKTLSFLHIFINQLKIYVGWVTERMKTRHAKRLDAEKKKVETNYRKMPLLESR